MKLPDLLHRVRWTVRRVFPALLFPLGSLDAQTLDATFDPNANAEIFSLAAQSDGKVLAGGNFTSLAGTTRSWFARLKADGSIDPAFNPAVNATVTAIRVQPDGKILIGGSFTLVGGSTRVRIARLNADGSVDLSFNASADSSSVEVITLQADGKILVGGLFNQLNGQSRFALGRLNADGSLDAAFDAAITSASSPNTLAIESIAVQADGRILIGGNFVGVGGQPRTNLARLNADGSPDPSFAPDANFSVLGIALQPDGKILVGGAFTLISGSPRNYLARLNAGGSLDAGFTPTADAPLQRIVLQSDGKILLAGGFSAITGGLRSRLARLNADGTLDATFDPNVNGSFGRSSPGVYAVVAPSPNQIVFGGAFRTVSGQTRNGLARLGGPSPTLTNAPGSVIAAAGASVTLSVASADGLRYQWQRNGEAIAGATGATLALAGVQAPAAGSYAVAVSNSFGTTLSPSASVAIGSSVAPVYTFSTLAGSAGIAGNTDATGSAARFRNPRSLAFDGSGNLCVIDTNGLRRITSSGVVTTLASNAGQAVAVGPTGAFFTLAPPSVRAYPPGANAFTFAGSPAEGYRHGPPGTGQFSTDLRSIAADGGGNLYVADGQNFSIRKVSPAGVITTLVEFDPYIDFDSPSAVGVDADGVVYFTYNLSGGIGRVLPNGAIARIASNLTALAEQRAPNSVSERLTGLSLDTAGNFFVADAMNHVLRRFDVAGNVTTAGGLRGSSNSTDGDGTAARFSTPIAIVVDSAGNLYVADYGNHTIRKGVPSVVPVGIAASPRGTQVPAGEPASFAVAANGSDLRFQWKKDGAAIAGATNATYSLASASPGDRGNYSVVVMSGGTSLESDRAALNLTDPISPGRLINIATRGLVEPGGALTPGFVLRGTGSKQLVVRGVGPTLGRFGVTGVLADPRIELTTAGGVPALTNDDWGTAGTSLTTTFAAVGAFPLDVSSKDAAALATLTSTNVTGFTLRLTGPDPTAAGLALAEVYDAGSIDSPVRLINVSTRGFVGTGAAALVPGLVIGGGSPLKILIRAVGPGLAPFGVTGVLADPQFTVVPLGSSSVVAFNDNWAGNPVVAAAFVAAGAFSLPPDSKDAAVVTRLAPGAYTVVVSGVNGATGVALVEIYEVP